MMNSAMKKSLVRRGVSACLQALFLSVALVGALGRAHAIDPSLINSARWSGWHARGGSSDQGVTVISSYWSERLFLFAKGQVDRGIYFAETLPNAGTVTWQKLSGTTFQPLAAIEASSGDLYAFARGDDTRVYAARRDPATKTWTAFVEVPGGMRTNSALAVAEGGNGRVYLFARRADQLLVYTSMDTRTRVWDTWRGLGRITDAAPAATSYAGKVYLVTKGLDRRVYLSSFDALTTKTWAGWQQVPSGVLTFGAVSVAAGSGKLTAVAVADSGSLYSNTLDLNANTWSAFVPIPGTASTQVAPSATYFDSSLVVLHRGNDSALYENIRQEPLAIERELTVAGSSNWVDTGFNVQLGDDLAVTAAGLWSNAGSAMRNANGYANLKMANSIAPNADLASLVGRIGSGPVFPVGASLLGSANASGRLYLRMNDVEGTYSDNSGSQVVTVAANRSVTVRVNARDGWTNTRVMMRKGSYFHGGASGAWATSCASLSGPCVLGLTADGYPGVKNAVSLVPSANVGSLVGWIAGGGFPMGKSFAGSFPAQAPLYLSMNDLGSALADNAGSVNVTLYPGDLLN